MENRDNLQNIEEREAAEGDGKVYSQEFFRDKCLWINLGRISWPAIIAGVMITAVAQLLLSLLGIGIGLAAIEPLSGQGDKTGASTIIWWSVTMLIALFLGGWVTGRLYPLKSKAVLSLHGLLTWCVFTFFSFIMLSTGVGALISGVGRLVGSSLSAGMNAAGSQVDMSGLLNEARSIALQPGAADNEVAARNAQVFLQNVEGFFRTGDMSPEGREALVNMIVQQTGMSRDEASTRADAWIARYEDMVETARVRAGEIADQAATASIIGFLALITGALVTIWGARSAYTREAREVAVV